MARKDEWDSVKLNKFGRVFYGLYLGITYPLRHPFVTIVVLLAFFRHELVDLCADYRNKLPEPVQQIAKIKDQTSEKFEAKLDEMKDSLSGIVSSVAPKKEVSKKTEEKKDRFVSWNVGKFNRAKVETKKANIESAFIKAQANVPDVINIDNVDSSKKIWNIENKKNVTQKNLQKSFDDEILALKYRKVDALGLFYLNSAENLYGKVHVVDAISLYIADRFVYLYGIDVTSEEYDEEKARETLSELMEGKEAHCAVVAKSDRDGSEKVLCFVGDLFINKELVKQNLVENVALR